MNALTVALFACIVVLAKARPSIIGASGVVSAAGAVGPAGIVTGHGAVGPLGVAGAIGPAGWLGAGVGALGLGPAAIGLGAWDDGQWRGEGLLESQDWAGHGAGWIGAHGW